MEAEGGRATRLRHVFGPVRSRRLGLSLGVNNIPYKVCSYTCVYCQLGRTLTLSIERRRYSDPDTVVAEVAYALEHAGPVDYVSFVPDGEPTLDSSLGEELARIENELGARTAVLTNSSLLWRSDVRRELMHASYVSVKLDAGDEKTWRRVDRPHPALSFDRVVEGILVFAREAKGALRFVTETMLVAGVNDSRESLEKIADIVAEAEPDTAYIAVPTRPPAEPWVEPPPAKRLVEAYEVFRGHGVRVELLAAPEPPPPSRGAGDPVEALYRVLAVHPLPVDVVERMLRERGVDPAAGLGRLRELPGVEETPYMGRRFLVVRPAKGVTRGTSGARGAARRAP